MQKEIFRIACDSLCGTRDVERAWLRRRLEGWHMHEWSSDPFARGAYSYVLVGGSHAPRLLARPVSATLFFAGEATEPEQSGTVAGAIASCVARLGSSEDPLAPRSRGRFPSL